MRFLRRVLIPVFVLLFMGIYAILHGRGEEGHLIDMEGRRVLIADGDTFRIGAEVIRLADIDAVERLQFCIDSRGTSWSCGQAARTALEQVLGRGGLICTTVERDRYGRTVARCTITGPEDVGAAIVSAGWAVAVGSSYVAEEKAARDAKRGIWTGTFEEPKVWRARTNVTPKVVG